ncbi:MAG TPA: FAD-binding oxidoreductase [Bryobacteraceae bacterium]
MLNDRIVVAGAGIVGASIAYHLAKRGARVTVVEASQPGAGATGKSFGWINATFSKSPRSYFELNRLAIAGWRRLEQELNGELQVQWGGSAAWFPPGDEADAFRQSIERHREWGYSATLIDERELRRLLPAVVPGEIGVAVWSEEEGAADPLQAANALLKKARQFGAEVLWPCEVTALDCADRLLHGIETTQGAMDAGALVLACGVDIPRLAEMAGVRVSLKDSPGVLIHTVPQPRLIDPVVLAPGAHFKQEWDGRIVAGGQIVAGVGTSTADARVDQAGQILRQVQRYVPELRDAEIERVTLGYRVMPQDEFPKIGFSRGCSNLYVAAMHSGVTLAPLIGELAAAEILDGVRAGWLEGYRI